MALMGDVSRLDLFRLPVGTVFHLSNYVVRRPYAKTTQPSVRNSDLESFQIEVSVNSTKPEVQLTIVKEANLPRALPLPQLLFITRKQCWLV